MEFLHRTWAEIDLSALKNNFEIIKREANGTPVMAVVKAKAYGHNDDIVAPLLDKWGAFGFAVSNIEEAKHLRDIGIKKTILILGYTPEIYANELAKYNISQCVFSKEYATALSESAKKSGVNIKIHIKLDTGMGRIGFDCRSDELYGIDEAIFSANLPNFELEGIFTHFAVADRNELQEDGFTDEQYSRFFMGVEKIKSAGLTPKICHCCNSAATCLDTDKHFDMCRAGITLYGLTPSADLDLKEGFIPVMTLKSVVSMVKTIRKGESVNYGRTFIAQKDTKIATVSVGYADGYPRLLSNKGYVLVKGKKAKIVGRVCMDQMSIDVSDIDDVKMGDEVVLFGKDLPVEEISNTIGTINYETVCDVSSRVPRIPV